ncbi:hypothetical protein LY76DRAFT_420053 [Colletotrichum caudatum]|nr:hypothetical protein LY76DRAFT_420053 [Colletotrichum caudatum]
MQCNAMDGCAVLFWARKDPNDGLLETNLSRRVYQSRHTSGGLHQTLKSPQGRIRSPLALFSWFAVCNVLRCVGLAARSPSQYSTCGSRQAAPLSTSRGSDTSTSARHRYRAIVARPHTHPRCLTPQPGALGLLALLQSPPVRAPPPHSLGSLRR